MNARGKAWLTRGVKLGQSRARTLRIIAVGRNGFISACHYSYNN